MGSRRRRGRALDGILLLDKASGQSSNHALQQIKRLFGAAKAGHTGSLDPLATGMLPICFGEATKLSGKLLNADKCYVTTCQFGRATDTGDADGAVIRESQEPLPDLTRLERAAERFVGEISQIPPMYSALKHQGQRLYELARQGQSIEREPRQVRIHALDILHWDADAAQATLRVRCSKGTYIRTLVEDLADACGQLAHVIALRRESLGPFHAQMWRYDALESLRDDGGHAALDRCLLPLHSAIQDWPQVTLGRDSSFYFRRGQAVQQRGAPSRGELAVLDESGHLLGLGEIDADGRVAPRRLLVSQQQNL